jgi:uncharacterized protein
MYELAVLITVIMVFSIIQSLFGVGLLVFGTPTLLLLGYSFEISLTYLLPSSIIISLVQIIHSKASLSAFQKKIFYYSVPSILVGLIFVITEIITFNIGLVVGLMLIISVLLRNIKSLDSFLKNTFKSNLNIYIFIMGFIHGISNMGGGFLTVLVTTLTDKKDEQRKNIACGYLIFGLTQLLVLIVMKYQIFTVWSLYLPVISLIIYFIIGNVIFKKTSDASFNKLISVLIFLYGIVLIINNLF